MQISNTEVIENVGQIDLIVADKTGTLTLNELIMREIYTDNKLIKINYRNQNVKEEKENAPRVMTTETVVYMRDFIEDERNMAAKNLFFCMSLCHTAIVQRLKKHGQRGFISESEDELALLAAARQIGFVFVKREEAQLSLKVFKENLEFKIRGLFPFDPVRKMMSIIVETHTGNVILFSKGADTNMLKRCRLENNRREKLQARADTMAEKSYRTMVLAMRPFTPELVAEFERY